MKKFLYRILIISIGLILITNIINITINISKAATYSFGFTGPTQANIGDNLTFTITANGLTGNVKLSSSNAILSNDQVWVEKNTVTISVKVTGFPAQITATPIELTDNDYNIVSIEARTITINEKITTQVVPTEPENQNNQQQNNEQTSNQGENNQGTQNNSNNSGNQQPVQSNSQGNSQTQNNNSGEGNNKNNLEVRSSNNYLKNLQVSVGTLSPEFYRETFEYTIDNVVEEDIEIIAEAEDERAIINGTGTVALKGGKNIINIEVVAENEQSRTYTITVNKKEEIKESDVRLKSLEIQTINEENKFEDLDIGFSKDILEYNTTVEDNITDLSVLATVEREGIIIEVDGDKNLTEGENIVTITLTKQSDDLTNGNKVDEDVINENIVAQNIAINENITTSQDSINENNTIQKDETGVEKTVYTIKVTKKAKPIIEVSSKGFDKNKILAIGILVGLIIIFIIVIILSHKKRKRGRRIK